MPGRPVTLKKLGIDGKGQGRQMRPPIIVTVEGNAVFFTSPDAAERYLEHYDVVSGAIAAAYDSEGRLLELRVVEEIMPVIFGLGRMKAEGVKVVPAETEPTHGQELSRLLMDLLQDLGAAKHEFEGLDLPRLELAALVRVGFRK